MGVREGQPQARRQSGARWRGERGHEPGYFLIENGIGLIDGGCRVGAARSPCGVTPRPGGGRRGRGGGRRPRGGPPIFAPDAGGHGEVHPVPTASPASLPSSGTGLIGLTERVELAGGSLSTTRTASGRFLLSARLPWPG